MKRALYGYSWYSCTIRVPLLDVEIVNPYSGKFHIGKGLVDSGATTIVINAEIAKALDINLDSCREVDLGGIGDAKGKFAEVTFKIHSLNYELKRLEVLFSPTKSPFDIIIGQKNVFNDYDIKFMKRDNKFGLQKRK